MLAVRIFLHPILKPVTAYWRYFAIYVDVFGVMVVLPVALKVMSPGWLGDAPAGAYRQSIAGASGTCRPVETCRSADVRFFFRRLDGLTSWHVCLPSRYNGVGQTTA